MSNRAESLLRCAQRLGDRTAILSGARRISFAELGDLACETAGGLRLLGISAGTRVGIMMPSQPEFIIVEQALFLLGAVVSPINVYYRPADSPTQSEPANSNTWSSRMTYVIVCRCRCGMSCPVW